MRVALITNPGAGRQDMQETLDSPLSVLQQAGWSVDVWPSEGPGNVALLARRAANEGYDVALVAGGDGTVNEAVQGLVGSETALGYLPYGTVNVWARELGGPLDLVGAARALVAGEIKAVDLGLANERYFLLMAGLGFDGAVVERARSLESHKRRLGVLPHVAAGLMTIPLYRGADLELRYDGIIRRVEALLLVVGNTRLYGGRFHFTPQAVANDGWLDLCIVKGRGPLSLLRQGLPLLLTGSIARSDVELRRVRELVVQSDTPLSLQTDGELVGSTPVHFAIAPAALRAIVPRDSAPQLIV